MMNNQGEELNVGLLDKSWHQQPMNQTHLVYHLFTSCVLVFLHTSYHIFCNDFPFMLNVKTNEHNKKCSQDYEIQHCVTFCNSLFVHSELLVPLSATYKHKDQNMQIYTLPVVLYGCETWSLTLSEVRGLW
jgi:hypothetical protein